MLLFLGTIIIMKTTKINTRTSKVDTKGSSDYKEYLTLEKGHHDGQGCYPVWLNEAQVT